ncbi:hypothetical protein ColKHC_00353 [Colletotrichum higginsianum]|nr:hypothetical protein ColKHC_00353 [Colletotrichum higginsianum]
MYATAIRAEDIRHKAPFDDADIVSYTRVFWSYAELASFSNEQTATCRHGSHSVFDPMNLIIFKWPLWIDV